MKEYSKETVDKIIKMFRPCPHDFLDYGAKDVICGPDDRAFGGMTTYFPISWLVEDFDFTEEEARWFIEKVRELNAEST